MNFNIRFLFKTIITFSTLLSIGCTVGAKTRSSEKKTPELFLEFTQSIPKLMSENDIPGLSIAVVDKDSLLWSSAFGYLNAHSQVRVNTRSVFSLQSISKTITATAIMLAVQEGLLSLDTPITAYLPDFTVNSYFEENPEKKITLRHLLSHRAGLTHEAPIGNNFLTKFESFEEHVQSISNTWLRAPVGEGPLYSNLGIDLAGYILQKCSGTPFSEYVDKRLFSSLDMNNSLFDWKTIGSKKNRAIGHDNNFKNIPLEFAMIPSGACYSDVIDMSKFLIFQMNKGKYINKILLEGKHLEEMYNIPFSNERYGMALGLSVYERAGKRCFRHEGGGFGFLTSLQWCPDLNIGLIILTNSANHNNVHLKIVDSIINKLRQKEVHVSKKKTKKQLASDKKPIKLTEKESSRFLGVYVNGTGEKTIELVRKDSKVGKFDGTRFIPFNFYSKRGDFFIKNYGPDYDGDFRIVFDSNHHRPLYIVKRGHGIILFFNERIDSESGSGKPEWKNYLGEYSFKMFGKIIATSEVSLRNGYLYFDGFRLFEHVPQVFYASNGEVLDFREDIPTYRNLRMYK